MGSTVPPRDWEGNYGPASESIERRIFAEACRESAWRITPLIATDCSVSPSRIQRMCSGEDASWFELSGKWLARAEKEGRPLRPLDNAIERFKTPEELEALAADMRKRRAGVTVAADSGLDDLDFIRRQLAEGRVSPEELPRLCSQLRRGVELFEEVREMVREHLGGCEEADNKGNPDSNCDDRR